MTGRYYLILFIASSLLALYGSFLAVDPLQQRDWLPAYLIYPLVLGTAIWLWRLLPLLASAFGRVRWQRQHLGVALALLTAWGFLLSRDEPRFNIVQDEYVLSAIAMNLHYNRNAEVPRRGQWVNNHYLISDGYLDKRPLFFPLVLATVHDVLSYDVNNVFYLNAGVTFLLLWLTYLLVCRLGGDSYSALLAVLALTSIPLLAQNAAGGGFELLNIVMLLITILLGLEFAKQPDAQRLTMLAYATFLLAQTRYESITFVLATGALILWVWWRERRVILSLEVILLPLLFVLPMWALQAVIYDRYWMQLGDNQASAFAMDYVMRNISNLGSYLFKLNAHGGMNPITAGTLTAGVLIYLRMAFTRNYIFFNVFIAVVTLNFITLMRYYWGDMSDFNSRRLLLVTLVIMAICSALAFNRHPKLRVAVSILLIFGFISLTLPYANRVAYSKAILLPRADSEALAYLRANDTNNERLLVAKDPYFFILHHYNVIGSVKAMQRVENMQQAQAHGLLQPYAYQMYFIHPDTGQQKYISCNQLNPQFSVTPMIKWSIGSYLYASLGPIAAIHPVPYDPNHDPACAYEIRTGNANFPKLTPEQQQRWLDNYP